MKKIQFAFFGTPQFSVSVLEKLKEGGHIPSLIVTRADKPLGRHLVLTSPPVKIWAKKHEIPFLQPHTLKDESLIRKLEAESWSVFIVASYGKIIPQEILDIPTHGTLNVHPSLLPKLRGSSPIQGAILEEKETGVTIMLLDAEMDHGPIVAQEKVSITDWPPYATDLEKILAEIGGKLLAKAMPDWVDGKIKEVPQNHSLATYTQKVKKEDAQINLEDGPEINLRKIRAYAGWPNAYTFQSHKGKKIRLVIKSAKMEGGILVLQKVIPEGRKEMSFEDFKRGISKD